MVVTTELVRAFILSWFLSHGYATHQAGALVEQARIESGFDHLVVNRRSGSSCLYQWVGPRRRELFRQSASNTCPSLEAQLRYADWELRTQSQYDGFWHATPAAAFRVLRACFGGGHC